MRRFATLAVMAVVVAGCSAGGEAGPAGAAGPTGPQGVQGIQGIQGSPGPSGTLFVDESNALTPANIYVNTATNMWVTGVNSVAVPAGAKVSVLAHWSVWPGTTTLGAACAAATCTTMRGFLPVCYRPNGTSTITAKGNSGFIWGTTASVNAAPPRYAGSTVGVFSGLAAGLYDFGLCARSGGSTNEMDLQVFLYNVAVTVHN